MSNFYSCEIAEEQIATLEERNRAIRKTIEKYIKTHQEALKTCAEDRAHIHMSALYALQALQHDIAVNIDGEINEPK